MRRVSCHPEFLTVKMFLCPPHTSFLGATEGVGMQCRAPPPFLLPFLPEGTLPALSGCLPSYASQGPWRHHCFPSPVFLVLVVAK